MSDTKNFLAHCKTLFFFFLKKNDIKVKFSASKNPELLVKQENSLIRNLRSISKFMTSSRMLFRIPAIKNLEISNENIGGGDFQVFRKFFPTNIYAIKL